MRYDRSPLLPYFTQKLHKPSQQLPGRNTQLRRASLLSGRRAASASCPRAPPVSGVVCLGLWVRHRALRPPRRIFRGTGWHSLRRPFSRRLGYETASRGANFWRTMENPSNAPGPGPTSQRPGRALDTAGREHRNGPPRIPASWCRVRVRCRGIAHGTLRWASLQRRTRAHNVERPRSGPQ